MSEYAVHPSQLHAQFNVPETLILPQEHMKLLGQHTLTAALKLALKQQTKLIKQHVFVLAEHDLLASEMLESYLKSSSKELETQWLVMQKVVTSTEYFWVEQEPIGKEKQVIVSQTPSYHLFDTLYTQANLFGRFVEKNDTSEFIPGALFSYSVVILSLEQLAKHQFVWRKLLKSLTEGYVQINDKYPPLPINCLVVLEGDYEHFSYEQTVEPKFSQAFSLFTECHCEFKYHQDTVSSYHTWLATLAYTDDIELALDAYPVLMRYSSTLVDHQQRLSLSTLKMRQCILQASLFSNTHVVNAKHIEQALRYDQQQRGFSQQRSLENFIDNFVHLQTNDQIVGQINALTVIEDVHCIYGEPARVTATVHYGDGEVADIERKSDLGGNLHAKGMMILSACLYRIFGKDEALHLNASIVFEQSYQEIDGDSASLAEYCALISAISEVPIIQSLAVTGAIDQFGMVQAIGGVNEKIMGFFEICRHRGLTGEHGVIIPESNVVQLNLPKPILKAIETKNFHIYQVKHVDEAIKLLTGEKPGEMDKYHFFPDETLYGKVQSRLALLADSDHDEGNFLKRFFQRIADFFG
tara:strand:- start:3410 stop:5155 length:1746 start_codon:yes stop_codon:yes gene_type:complete